MSPTVKFNHNRTIIFAEDTPVLTFNHFRTKISKKPQEDGLFVKNSNISRPQSVQKTPVLKCKHF